MLASLALTAFLGCAPQKSGDSSEWAGYPAPSTDTDPEASGVTFAQVWDAMTLASDAAGEESWVSAAEANSENSRDEFRQGNAMTGEKTVRIDPTTVDGDGYQVSVAMGDYSSEMAAMNPGDFFGTSSIPQLLKLAVGNSYGADQQVPAWIVGGDEASDGSGDTVQVQGVWGQSALFLMRTGEDTPENFGNIYAAEDESTGEIELVEVVLRKDGAYEDSTVTEADLPEGVTTEDLEEILEGHYDTWDVLANQLGADREPVVLVFNKQD